MAARIVVPIPMVVSGTASVASAVALVVAGNSEEESSEKSRLLVYYAGEDQQLSSHGEVRGFLKEKIKFKKPMAMKQENKTNYREQLSTPILFFLQIAVEKLIVMHK